MKNYCINIRAFTFVELVISITIIAILSVLGFVSYSKNLEDSRDSQRVSELSGVASGLKVHKTKRGDYPSPGNSFVISNLGTGIINQGKLNSNVIISTIDKIPLDPFINVPYVYSITNSKKEFQLSATLENNGVNKALLLGDYKPISKNILPTIVLAVSSSSQVEINASMSSGATSRTKFVFNNSTHNLPYSFIYPFSPYTDNTTFTGLLSDANIVWWQNSDYRNCAEILADNKNIGSGEYQINSGGTLTNTNCSY